MKKIKTIIVDDMPLAIANLKADLEDSHPNIEIIDTANGVMEAAKKIKKLHPELIFLDVHMGDGDGFDLLEIIETAKIKVIFTTASKDHAIKAFQFSASDYLLKPVDPDLLKQAIDKIMEVHISPPSNKPQTLETITLNTQEEVRLVRKDQIVRLEAMGNYTHFHLVDDSKVLVTKTMKEYEKTLGPAFIRVHQSHLVHKLFIKAYVKSEGGYLELINGQTVPVSFRKKAQVIEALSNQ